MADNPDVNPPNLLIKKSENNPPHESYTLYADDNTFPQRSRILQAPELVNTLTRRKYLNSLHGWQFFLGEYVDRPLTKWAVMWNPITNECFRIDVTPNEGYRRSVVGFGEHPITGVTLVKISFSAPNELPLNAFSRFDVDVCTLSTLAWTNVIQDGPFMLSYVECAKVCVDWCLFFRAFDDGLAANGDHQRTNHLFLFNLVTNEFGLVNLPPALLHTARVIQSVDVNGSLGLLVYVNQDLDNDPVCDVIRIEVGLQAGLIHTIMFRNNGNQLYGDVLGFRNNGVVANIGEPVVELRGDGVANIGLYDRQTHDINGNVEIHGNPHSFVVRPYFGNVNY